VVMADLETWIGFVIAEIDEQATLAAARPVS
jgi:hypothetical protein